MLLFTDCLNDPESGHIGVSVGTPYLSICEADFSLAFMFSSQSKFFLLACTTLLVDRNFSVSINTVSNFIESE